MGVGQARSALLLAPVACVSGCVTARSCTLGTVRVLVSACSPPPAPSFSFCLANNACFLKRLLRRLELPRERFIVWSRSRDNVALRRSALPVVSGLIVCFGELRHPLGFVSRLRPTSPRSSLPRSTLCNSFVISPRTTSRFEPLTSVPARAVSVARTFAVSHRRPACLVVRFLAVFSLQRSLRIPGTPSSSFF